MSNLNVNSIVNSNNDGPVELSRGATIPSGYAINSSGGVNVVGVLTATTFVGSGNNLTGLTVVTNSSAIAIKRIIGYDEYRY